VARLLRGKSSLFQVEIALLFGKQIVREERCSCKAKSHGEKKASGDPVVAQRGREFHEQAPSSREQFFAAADVSQRARRRANPRCTRPGYRRAFRLLHALVVGSVAESLARIRPAGELSR